MPFKSVVQRVTEQMQAAAEVREAKRARDAQNVAREAAKYVPKADTRQAGGLGLGELGGRAQRVEQTRQPGFEQALRGGIDQFIQRNVVPTYEGYVGRAANDPNVRVTDYGYDPSNPATQGAARRLALEEASRRAERGIDAKVVFPGEDQTLLQGAVEFGQQFGQQIVDNPIIRENPALVRAKEIAAEAARVAAPHVLPGGQALQAIGEALPYVPTPGGLAETAVETTFPTRPIEVLAETIPGIGFGPDIVRVLRKGGPEAAAMARRLASSPEGTRLLERFASEAGSVPLGPKPGDKFVEGAGDALAKPVGDVLPSPPETTTSAGIQPLANKMRGMIATARNLGPEQARMISEQKSARVGGAAARLEKGGGLPAFHESKSFLAGEYGKPTFEPLNLPTEDVGALVDHIATSGGEYFDRLGALTAIEKATMGIKPADNELDKLEMFFPEMRQAFDQQAMSGTVRGVGDLPRLTDLPSAGMQPRLAEAIDEAYVGAIAAGKGTPEEIGKWTRRLQLSLTPLSFVKTIKTSFDVGWAGRQGWRLLPRNPAEWGRMWLKQFKALKSEKGFAEIDSATKAFPNFERSQSMERPLAYLERGTGNPETAGEEFLIPKGNPVTDFARKIFNPSERAYVAPGNWMRQAVLDKQVRRIVKATGKPVSDADFQLLLDSLNNATLRGNTKWLGTTNAQTLASLAFSLKGQVSGPQFALDALRVAVNGGDMYSHTARKIVAEQFGAYVAMGMSVLGLAAATGYGMDKQGKSSWVSADLNPFSKTFGEMGVAGFRWNYWGADAPLVRYALAVAQGKQRDAPGLKRTDADRLRLTKNFVGGKVAPGIPRAVFVGLTDKGYDPYIGKKINTKEGALIFAIEQVDPLFFANALDAYKDLGPAAVVPSLLANELGLTTSTYDTSPSEDQLEDAKKATFRETIEQSAYNGIPDRAVQRYLKDNNLPGQTYEEFIAETKKRAEAKGRRHTESQAYQAVTALVSAGRESQRRANPALDAAIVITENAVPLTQEASDIVFEETGIRVSPQK